MLMISGNSACKPGVNGHMPVHMLPFESIHICARLKDGATHPAWVVAGRWAGLSRVSG